MYKAKPKLPTLPCDWLVFDISNLLYRTFFSQTTADDITLAGMAAHSGLITLNKYYKHFKPTKGIIMTFDRSSWRKEYTASEGVHPAVKPYKGNRRQDMTDAQAAKFERFINHLKEFEELITKYTNIITMACDRLEADDLIAGVCQIVEGDNVVIISADSDLLQLKRYAGVHVISPATDQEAVLADFNGDPVYYVFHKCFRGDPTDNIQSAYPRVQSKKILEAYTDPYARAQLLKQTWTDQAGNTVVVEDMFKENEILINLEHQPDDIKQLIWTTVDEALSAERKFSMFFLLKFCKRYELKRIIEQIDQFVPMLSGRTK